MGSPLNVLLLSFAPPEARVRKRESEGKESALDRESEACEKGTIRRWRTCFRQPLPPPASGGNPLGELWENIPRRE